MGKIYSKARLVVVWLGEEDSHTVPAFALMERISKLATVSAVRSLNANASDIFNPDALQAMGLPSFPSADWESMHRLFERRWFQRSWVIQEVALADDAVVVVAAGFSIGMTLDALVNIASLVAFLGLCKIPMDVKGDRHLLRPFKTAGRGLSSMSIARLPCYYLQCVVLKPRIREIRSTRSLVL